MTGAALPLSAPDTSSSALAVDTVAEAIEAGRLHGLAAEEPMVAAMLWLLELIDWRPSTLRLVQALPHQAGPFTLADLRATLMRLDIASTERKLGRQRAADLPKPSLVITPSGRALVLEPGEAGGISAYDPLSGEVVQPPTDPATRVITFHRPETPTERSFTRALARRFNRTAAKLMLAKGGLNLIAIAAVLGLVMIYDTIVPARADDTLIALCIAVGLSIGLDLFLRRTKARLLSRTAARMEYIIGVAAFRKVLSLPFDRLATGSVTAQTARLRQLTAVGSALSGPAAEIALELPFTVLMIVALFAIGGPIGLVPVVLFALFAIAAAILAPRLRRLGTAARIAREEHDQVVTEIILETEAIHDAGAPAIWEARAQQTGQRQAEAQRKVDTAQLVLNGISAAATPLAGGATAIIGAHLAIQGSLTAGALIGAMVLTWRIIAPLQAMLLLIAKWTDLVRMSGQLDRLMRLSGEPAPSELPLRFEMRGQISLRRAAFRYPGTQEPALRGLSLDIPEGALVAVTGPSGAGKTTLLRIVLGLIKPMSGSILIDGMNLGQIPLSQLRDLVSYVPHAPVLIHGTVAQNLRLARPLASDMELHEALEELSLSRAVAALPHGMETRLSEEMQANLPAGFRQSLALAQAFLRQPRILLLDEPARMLDPVLESAMISALQTRRGKVTTLMATHRPSHVRLSDFELALEAGMVRRMAPTKELVT